MHLARLPRDGVSEGDPKALEKSLFRCVPGLGRQWVCMYVPMP